MDKEIDKEVKSKKEAILLLETGGYFGVKGGKRWTNYGSFSRVTVR